MKTLFALTIAAAVTIVVLFTGGCASTSPKNLTPFSAKRLLQERFQAEHLDALVGYAPTAALMGVRTFVDYQQDRFTGYTPEGALHRLLKAGFVKQVEGKGSYPNLTGTYTGSRSGWFAQQRSYTISMQLGSPVIDGTYEVRSGNSYCRGRISGSLNADDTVTITILLSGASGNWCNGSNTDNIPYRTQRTSDGIRLAETAGGIDLFCKGCAGGTLELTTYEYRPTPKFLKSVVVSGQTMKAGHYQVDSVDNLFLGETETSAQGQYTWHVDYNPVVQAITGGTENHGVEHAMFRKQPDGVWVCVSH